MINGFGEWASPNLVEHANISQLKGAAVGIEAADYLERLEKFNIPDLSRPVKEALLPALGGVPFGLKYIIRTTLQALRRNGITPIFVFSGLDVGKKDVHSAPTMEAAPIIHNAWQLYDNLDADGAVENFRQARSVTPEDLFRFLQLILREEQVEYHIAPYSANAQVGATLQLWSALTLLACLLLRGKLRRRHFSIARSPSLQCFRSNYNLGFQG